MKNHLIVTVHGIGEHEPGASLDEFVGAARTHTNLKNRSESDVRFLKEESDEQLPSLFPCHVTKLRSKSDDEYTFTEVYWSDLSPSPRGAINTMIDLFRVILGLGYILEDNIKKQGCACFVQAMTWTFMRVMYGFVAPANVVLLLGAITLLIDGRWGQQISPDPTQWSGAELLLVLGLTSLAVTLLASGRLCRTPIGRDFFLGFVLLAVIVTLTGVTSFWGTLSPENVPRYCATAPVWLYSGQAAVAEYPNLNSNEGIDCFVAILVGFLNLAWLTAIGCLIALALFATFWSERGLVLLVALIVYWFVTSGFSGWLHFIVLAILLANSAARGYLNKFADLRVIYIAICSAMIVLWAILSTAFWLVFWELTANIPIDDPESGSLLSEVFDVYFKDATQTIYAVFAVLVVLIFVGLIVAIARWAARDKFKKHPTAGLWLRRLILNPVINILLYFSAFAISVSVVAAVVIDIKGSGIADFCAVQGETISGIICSANDASMVLTAIAVPTIGLMGAVLFKYSSSVSLVLGIVRDIIAYSRLSADPKVGIGKNTFFGLKPNWSKRERERINSRFSAVLKHHLCDGHEFKHVMIVSHSLGTMVAAKTCKDDGLLGNAEKLDFVTMGSPISHIYQHYFDETFDSLISLKQKLDVKFSWLNLYRVDDFVGTDVSNKNLPVDRSLEVKKTYGHSGYWRDPSVWENLCEHTFFKDCKSVT